MTRIAAMVAATLAAFAASADDIRYYPGREPAKPLTDVERAAAHVAIDTLSAELGIDKDQVFVDTVRAVEWRDSSLGCPQPGVAYLDVISQGHRVLLRVDGQVHAVHEAGNRAFVCVQTKAMGGITPQRDLTFGPQMVAARRDLASRLGVSEREILFLSGEGKTWPDASLGCPEPGVMYTQAQVRGWVLTFGYRQRIYTYHTDLNRTIPCPPIEAQ
jgi:hypothetical protein